MTQIDRAFLDKHYNENIFLKNREKLLSGGTGDSFLALSGKDEGSFGIAA